MVKKLLITISMLGLIPASVVQADEYIALDAELEMYEDQLDLIAEQKFGALQPMARKSRSDSDKERDRALEVIGAIIGAIGDDANHRRPPGYRNGSRQVRCFAVDGRRRYYQAIGQVQHRVERRALNICYNYGARFCRIAYCETIRRR